MSKSMLHENFACFCIVLNIAILQSVKLNLKNFFHALNLILGMVTGLKPKGQA